MDDNKIIELYFCRDETAVKHTSEKYGNCLRALAYGIIKDHQTAEECENDTYLEAWNSIPPHEPRNYLQEEKLPEPSESEIQLLVLTNETTEVR